AVGAPGRDANHEDAVLAAVRELWPCGDGTDQQELVDAEAAVFIDQILPRLEALEHLTVHEHGTRPDHTELRGTPALRIRQREGAGVGGALAVRGRDRSPGAVGGPGRRLQRPGPPAARGTRTPHGPRARHPPRPHRAARDPGAADPPARGTRPPGS